MTTAAVKKHRNQQRKRWLTQLEKLRGEADAQWATIERIRARRDKIILSLVDDGNGATTIGKAAGLSTTAIYQIRNRAHQKATDIEVQR